MLPDAKSYPRIAVRFEKLEDLFKYYPSTSLLRNKHHIEEVAREMIESATSSGRPKRVLRGRKRIVEEDDNSSFDVATEDKVTSLAAAARIDATVSAPEQIMNEEEQNEETAREITDTTRSSGRPKKAPKRTKGMTDEENNSLPNATPEGTVMSVATAGNLDPTVLAPHGLTSQCCVCEARYSGSHSCKKCRRRCHVFCASEVVEEGYGSSVLCLSCYESPELQTTLESGLLSMAAIDEFQLNLNASSSQNESFCEWPSSDLKDAREHTTPLASQSLECLTKDKGKKRLKRGSKMKTFRSKLESRVSNTPALSKQNHFIGVKVAFHPKDEAWMTGQKLFENVDAYVLAQVVAQSKKGFVIKWIDTRFQRHEPPFLTHDDIMKGYMQAQKVGHEYPESDLDEDQQL